jgi:hypothetical protein
MKYNPQTLNKLEKVFSEAEYVIRYERGNFQSGYCILEDLTRDSQKIYEEVMNKSSAATLEL